MEAPEIEWVIEEYSSPEEEEEKSMMSCILRKGLSLGKKLVITSIVVSSAPLILPPLVVVSALGFAFSIPSGFFLASYTCTQSLMNKLLPLQAASPPLLGYEPVYEAAEWRRMEDGKEKAEIRYEFLDLRRKDKHVKSNGDELEDLERKTKVRRVTGDEFGEEGGYEEDDGDYLDLKEGLRSGGTIKHDEKASDKIRENEHIALVAREGRGVGNEDIVEDISSSKERKDIKEESTGLLEKFRDDENMSNVAGEGERTNAKISEVVRELKGSRAENEPDVKTEQVKGVISESGKPHKNKIPKLQKLFGRKKGKPGERRDKTNPKKEISRETEKSGDNDDLKSKKVEEVIRETAGSLGEQNDNRQTEDNIEISGPREKDNLSSVSDKFEEANKEDNSNIQAKYKPTSSEIIGAVIFMEDNLGQETQEAVEIHESYSSAIQIDREGNVKAEHIEFETMAIAELPETDAGERAEYIGEETASEAYAVPPPEVSKVQQPSEEKLWEQIIALRTVVGYKSALKASCMEELKALYIFTGVEPPSSFKKASDLAEVNDKLQFLKSIVGVK